MPPPPSSRTASRTAHRSTQPCVRRCSNTPVSSPRLPRHRRAGLPKTSSGGRAARRHPPAQQQAATAATAAGARPAACPGRTCTADGRPRTAQPGHQRRRAVPSRSTSCSSAVPGRLCFAARKRPQALSRLSLPALCQVAGNRGLCHRRSAVVLIEKSRGENGCKIAAREFS